MSRGVDRPRGALGILDREEEQALAALKQALASAGADLPALAEVRALTRRHPELTIAASAAVGVLLAPMLASVARTALPVLMRSLGHGGARSLVELTRRSLR